LFIYKIWNNETVACVDRVALCVRFRRWSVCESVKCVRVGGEVSKNVKSLSVT
jgi:hypothetical protein